MAAAKRPRSAPWLSGTPVIINSLFDPFRILRISVAKKPKLLSDHFHDTLKDVYFSENKKHGR